MKAGHITLAGAGPGDPELITVKLQKRLAEADVIITDRLVNPAIISGNASPAAVIILAGKQGYNDAGTSQQDINSLIVQHGIAGKKVLRLKGGDVAFFSNVLDELNAIVENGLTFDIIPGITAAAGAAAYTGIPLTARGYAQGVQLLSFNPGSMYPPEKWKQLAATNDTLVFYMSAKNISGLAELLLRYSRRPSTPLAVIEQATTPFQQVHTTTLEACHADFEGTAFSSPSLVVVGDVVKLHETFGWYAASAAGSVFPELLKTPV